MAFSFSNIPLLTYLTFNLTRGGVLSWPAWSSQAHLWCGTSTLDWTLGSVRGRALRQHGLVGRAVLVGLRCRLHKFAAANSARTRLFDGSRTGRRSPIPAGGVPAAGSGYLFGGCLGSVGSHPVMGKHMSAVISRLVTLMAADSTDVWADSTWIAFLSLLALGLFGVRHPHSRTVRRSRIGKCIVVLKRTGCVG